MCVRGVYCVCSVQIHYRGHLKPCEAPLLFVVRAYCSKTHNTNKQLLCPFIYEFGSDVKKKKYNLDCKLARLG